MPVMAASTTSSDSNDTKETVDEEILVWKQVAISIQQTYHNIFEHRVWEKIDNEPKTLECLRRNIGFSLFGPPPELPQESNLNTGYTIKQLKKIKKLCPSILKQVESESKVLMFLFVGVKIKDQYKSLPIFRIRESEEPDKENDTFIDYKGRIYKGWQDFLNNNTVSADVMCCPKDGLYTETDGKVNIEFISCQTSSIPQKIITALNITTAVAATSVGIATLLTPVSGGILLAVTIGSLASGLCGLGEGVSSLIDRKLHGQTLSLKSSDVRDTYLGIAGGTTSLILGGIDVVTMFFNSSFLRLTSTLTIGSSAFKGLELINSLTNIALKIQIKDNVSPLEVFQFSASVLFFSGSLLTMKTAYVTLKSMSLPDNVNPIPGVLSSVENVEKAILPNITKELPTKEKSENKTSTSVNDKDKVKYKNMPDEIDEHITVVKYENIDDNQNDSWERKTSDGNSNADASDSNNGALNFFKSLLQNSLWERDKSSFSLNKDNEKERKGKNEKPQKEEIIKLEDATDGAKMVKVIDLKDGYISVEEVKDKGSKSDRNFDGWKTLRIVRNFLTLSKQNSATYAITDHENSDNHSSDSSDVERDSVKGNFNFKENAEDEKLSSQELSELLLNFERHNSAAEMKYQNYLAQRRKPNIFQRWMNIHKIIKPRENPSKETEKTKTENKCSEETEKTEEKNKSSGESETIKEENKSSEETENIKEGNKSSKETENTENKNTKDTEKTEE